MADAKEISLSVEETNRLRLKLGLKPLRVDTEPKAKPSQDGDSEAGGASSSDPHAHLTAAELEERRRQAARQLAERTEERKRKAVHAAMTGGPTLGEDDDDLDDPAAWVARMRKNDKEKRVLASQARVDAAHYDDSDDESGSGVSGRRGQESPLHPAKRHRGAALAATDGEQAGGDVKVVHDLKDFAEGETVVLTLKDSQILTADGALNEEMDTLENVALAEKKKLQKLLREKEKKTVYDPTEDWEEGEDGQPKKKEILEHYDAWEREELAAQGKGPPPDDDRGFVLPSLQGRELDEPVEVQIELLRERQRLVEREKQKVMGLTSLAAYHSDGIALTGANLSRQKYDASGPSSVVLGGEREAAARADGGAGEAVAFRKLKKKKKIQKKKQGAEFWKELLGGKPQEEEDEEKEAQDDEIKPAAGGKPRKADRHHGSRGERRERDSKKADSQKQHVREALEAAETATKHVSPQPTSSSSRREREGKDEGSDRRSRGKEGSSRVEKAEREGMEEDVEDSEVDDLAAADRELQESLEKQRRLACLKLREQETEDAQAKTPQVRLLSLLRSQAKGRVVEADQLPVDGSSSPSKGKDAWAAAPRDRRAGFSATSEAPAEDEEDETQGLQLSTTTEFCRAIQTPLEKLQSMKQEPYGSSRQRQEKPAHAQQPRGEKRSKSNETAKEEGEDSDTGDRSEERRNKEKDEDSSEEEEDLETGFMNENPMGHGLAEALKYLQSKNHYSLDKMRQRRHRPDELPLHKPLGEKDIKIDHRDRYGNVMTPKDAFREISWRFHGKYPSLRKQEKKMKKMDIERKLLQNPMEALPTLNALQRLQEKEKASHLVLTGGSMD
uniref:Os02g0511500 protein, related n=1 Tax=Neospora caninum (strain Liverpool) TaxID=572307 RepID=A0A0F7U648_NEOCL|nr:TPA: Os02g0511500 protein, related [Neospora caninum Liverpool]